MTENTRASLKIIYSCFDCDFFKNKSMSPQIEKEKYRCMLEKEDFDFQDMSPTGLPSWCPLPRYDAIKEDKVARKFKEIYDKLNAKK